MWLTIREVESLGISRRSIFDKIEQWKTQEVGKAANGKLIREIALESLPDDLQLKWAQLNRQTEIFIDTGAAPDPEETLNAANEVQLTLALQRFDEPTRIALLAEAHRLLSIVERFQAITPRQKKNRHGKYEYVPAVYQLCKETVCTDPLVLAVEPGRKKERSPHTLNHWMRFLPTEGLVMFLSLPKPKAVRQTDKRLAAITPAAIMWFDQNWKKHPHAKALHKKWKAEAKKRGWKIPSSSWTYRYYDNVPAVVKTYLFEGEKAYTSKYKPFLPRTYEDLEALQVLCGDHSVRDVTVMLKDGSLIRPWLTMWQDLRTGLIWGWHLDVTPSSQTIGLAYANGVQTYGAQPLSRPDEGFYSYIQNDQGKDYRSEIFEGKTLTFKTYQNAGRIDGCLQALCTQRKVGFLEETGLKQILARGYNAREKMIERTHRVISDWEQNTFQPEYCGRKPSLRPERWSTAWKRHQKLRRKFKDNLHLLRQSAEFMTLEDYREALEGFINEYNTTVHVRATLGGDQIVPLLEYQRLYTTHYSIPNETLALMLMKAERRKILKNGIQMFRANWFFGHPDLAKFKGGTELEIRYSEGDFSRIYVVLPPDPITKEPGRIVEAELLTPSSMITPNKKTMARVKQLEHKEKDLVRDYSFLNQSKLRGETVEDRMARIQEEEDPEIIEVQLPVAAVAGGTVIPLTRFSGGISRRRGNISTQAVSAIATDESLYSGSGDEAFRLKEEWEPE